jgi:hypothetical protein
MDINAMKRAAKLAARKNGTSHGAELNTIAKAQGFTHWGALIAAQPKPGFGYRYHPTDHINACDLERARRLGNHIVYIADDIEVAIGYVINMANTVSKLMPKDTAKSKGFIAKPDRMAVLEDNISRNWRDMPQITSREISQATANTVVFVERLSADLISATPKGVTLIGACINSDVATWHNNALARLEVLIIPTQDTLQIGKIYSKEDQAIIYATTSLKYVQPQNDAETVRLIERMVSPTNIKQKNLNLNRANRMVM